MNIYVYITALGMVLIGLYFVWRENKRERKAEQKKQECNKQQPEKAGRHAPILPPGCQFPYLLFRGPTPSNASRPNAIRMVYRIDAAYQSEKAFISNASHELNNPLTAIQGECEISLLKERTPAEYQSALKRIASENKRIIQLMQHLLPSHFDKQHRYGRPCGLHRAFRQNKSVPHL